MQRRCTTIFLNRLERVHSNFSRGYAKQKTKNEPEYEPIESRSTFRLVRKNATSSWFPKHMAIQFERMEARLRAVDLIVEVCFESL